MSQSEIKISYGKLFDVNSGMYTSLTQIATMRFAGAPLSFLIAISENSVELENHNKVFQKTREGLLQKHGEQDEDGTPKVLNGQIHIPEKNILDFNKDFDKLSETEITVKLTKLSQSDLERTEELTPNMVKGLIPILKD